MAQVLILRELLVLARGQELKLALGLWCWLLWTGLGALLGGRRPSWTEVPPGRLGGLLTLLGLLLPATILAIRGVPAWVGVAAGQVLPLAAGLGLFLALLAPFGLVSGYFFPCACRALADQGPGGAPGRVYGLETLGAALGVLVLQLFLLGRYGSSDLSLAAGLLLVLSPLLLDRPLGWRRLGLRLSAALLLLLAFGWLTQLEDLSRSWQMPGRRVTATADSPYAFLSASRESGQVSFFANNLWQFTHPDPFTAECQVQLGLLAQPNPRRVLLLGGGPGLVPEILKTSSIDRLDYVEIDPQLVNLAKSLLSGAGGWLRDPRVHVHYQDARHFVTHTSESYDVILMVLPEPRSAQLNRFYSREFFALVAARLSPEGVFNFSLPGSATSLHPWREAYLAMTYHTLRQVFPEVLALPGERVQFLGAAAPSVLTADPNVLAARLQARKLSLQYLPEYYLRDELTTPKVAHLKQVLDRQPPETNTDLRPGCYFYDLALGGIQEGLPIGQVLISLKHLPAYLFWALLGVVTLLLTGLMRNRPGLLCLYQVTVMGLGTMALEILVLILYQIHLGSLYRQLGLLIAAFMAGMAAGAVAGGFWLGPAAVGTGRGPRALGRRLAVLQLLLAALPLLLALALRQMPWSFLSERDYLVQGGLALVLAAAGFGGGGVFALSAGLWVQSQGESGAKGGRLYAADLLGSTLGTLGFSLVIIPVWGIWPALVLLAGLHAGAALMLVARPSAPKT